MVNSSQDSERKRSVTPDFWTWRMPEVHPQSTGTSGLNNFQRICLEFYRRCLADEIKSQQHCRHPIALLNPSLGPLQRPGFDPHTHAFADRWREPDAKLGFKSQQNVIQLPLECFLVKNLKQVGNMVVLANRFLLAWLELQENVAGEKRLLEDRGFAPVFMSRFVAGQSAGEALARAKLDQLLLPSRPGMRDEPKQLGLVSH